jgi:polysaccharide export outer membrane protein
MKIIFAALLAAAYLVAQESASEFTVRSKEKTISPAEIVKRFEGPQVNAYTLGEGDEISLDVWMHPELSGKHVVGPDGKITVPVAGVLALSQLTREDAQAAVLKALSRFYTDLSVTLRVDRYTSFRIYILGRVSTPGAVQFESQPTLLDVVTKAGALPIGGIGADKAGLGRCAIIRKDQMIWVDLKALVSQGNLSLNIHLSRNDIVYMPDAGDQLVYVLGEVRTPGAFRLTPDMSFLDAFTLAGGLGPDASPEKIEVVRSTTGAHREIAFKDLLSSSPKTNVSLEEGDIIYVPQRRLAKFGYVLQKASPLSAFAIVGSIFK